MSGASRKPYVARRRGVTGIIAALLAVAGVATLVIMTVGGTIGEQSNVAVGIGVATVLAALFAYRRVGRSSTVRLDEDGMLSLVFGDTQHTFDLSNPTTEVEMVGAPGDSGWTIRLLRPGLSPIEVDTSSVDPIVFSESLRQWRPDL